MTIYGWDASHYDWDRGPMDLGRARSDGIDFFTHKATEGSGYRDDRFPEAMQRAQAAGFPFIGPYHVVRSGSIEPQVDNLYSYVSQVAPWWKDHPGWFIQCDLEKWEYDSVPADLGEQWADAVESRFGGRVCIMYASKGQYGDSLSGTSHPLWNANYGSNNTGHYLGVYDGRGGDSGAGWVTYSGAMPALWQYGSRTTIGGQGTCDANAFRGTVSDFAALIKGGTPVGSDDKMLVLAEPHGGSQLYLCDGITSRPVSHSDADAIAYMASKGTYTLAKGTPGPEWREFDYGQWVRLGWSEGGFGVLVTP